MWECKVLQRPWVWVQSPSGYNIKRLNKSNGDLGGNVVGVNTKSKKSFAYHNVLQNKWAGKKWPAETTEEEIMIWLETMIATGAVDVYD